MENAGAAEAAVNAVDSSEAEAGKRRRPRAAVKDAEVPSRDSGDWKYRPWSGIDHWVNERTGASTFDLKKVR